MSLPQLDHPPRAISPPELERANRTSLRLLLGLGCFSALWMLAAELVAPRVIAMAYRGESWAVFNHLIRGRASHPLADYLATWSQLTWGVLAGGVAIGIFLLITTRPELERICARIPVGTMVVVVILPLAVVLCAHAVDARCLDIDEITSVVIARASSAVFWDTALRREANGWPYLLFLRMWLRPGMGDSGVRLLSVGFAVATLPVVYALGKRLGGKLAGWLASLLLAVNSFQVKYAREARTYAVLIFAATLSSYLFVRAIQRPSRKNWAAYILASAFAVHSHVFFALVLVAHWLSLLLFRRNDTPWRAWIISNALIALLCLPLLLVMMVYNVGQIDWISRFRAADVYDFFFALTGSGGTVLLAAYTIALLIALAWAFKAWVRELSSQESWAFGLLFTWLLLPVLVLATVSLKRPVFVPRYLIFCLPPLVLLAGAAIARLRPIPLLAASAVLLLALGGRGVAWYYRWHGSEDWKDASHYLLSSARAEDAVLFYHPYTRLPIEYYGGDLDGLPGQPVVLFPARWDRSQYISQPEIQQKPEPELLPSLPGHYQRVWLVLGHDQFPSREATSRSIQRFLADHYSAEVAKNFAQVRVILYQHPDANHAMATAPHEGR